MSINTADDTIMQQNKSETQVKKGFFSSIFDMLFTPVIKPLEINKPSNDVRVDTAIKEIKQWQHDKVNEEQVAVFESTEQQAKSLINGQDQQELTTNLGEAIKTIQDSSAVKSSHDDQQSRLDIANQEKLNIDTADLAKRIAANEKVAQSSKYQSEELNKLFAVSNNELPKLNIVENSKAKVALESCIKSSIQEEENEVNNKSVTEMNETELNEYAKERVEQSPLKLTLSGISFPKRKIAKKVDQNVEGD